MTIIFAQGGFLSDVAALLTAATGLIALILGFWKYLDERKKRLDAEKRELDAEERNAELEGENARLVGKTDRWGSRLGTQAARINELFSSNEFRTIDEVYETLVREFPTTTRARVSSHVR